MSENLDLREIEAARGHKVGVRFIKLEEIHDVSEEQSEEQITKQAELRIRLRQAMTSQRQERELYDHMLEQGQEIEIQIKELTAENKSLVSHVKELKQKVTHIKKRRQEKDEEDVKPQRISSELIKIVMNQTVYISNMEKDIRELWEQTSNLRADRDRLVALKKKTQQTVLTHTADEVALKLQLYDLKGAICEKDDQIQKTCLDLKAAFSKISDCNISKELTLDCKNIFDELMNRQSHIICKLKSCMERQTFIEAVPQILEYAPVVIYENLDKKSLKTARFSHLSAWGILKAPGTITLCALCVLMFMANLVPVCSSPDYDLWTIFSEFLETYGEVELALPSVL